MTKRLYDEAITEYVKLFVREPQNIEARRGIALAYHKCRNYSRALEWWNRVLDLNPEDDDAQVKRWEVLIKSAEADSVLLKKIRLLITEEVRGLLSRAKDVERAFSLAVDGLRLADCDTSELRSMEDSLITLFPNSKKAYELVGERFYAGLYPIWRNDTLKLEFLSHFLDDYPETEWRFTAYQYLLSSLYTLKEVDKLKNASEKLISEDSLNPFVLNYVSYIYLESGINEDRALLYARRAVELDSLSRKPSNKSEPQWTLEKKALYGNSRMNYARALLQRGSLDEAELWIRDAIENTPFDVNHYRTLSPYWFILAQIQEKQGFNEKAVGSYINALIQGDVRNYWSSKADSALRRLYERKFSQKEDLLHYAREIVGYEGPYFVDVTDPIGLGERRESRIAWGDYDLDGYDDLLLNGSRLFKNIKGEKFVDVTEKVGIANTVGSGGVWGDYDNDGSLDFYTISSGKNTDRLWHNNGEGSFTDVTHWAGEISDSFPTEGAAWGDLDGDGYLDLYVANYEIWGEHRYFPDRLYQNKGDGTFVEVSEDVGIIPPFDEHRAGRGVACADYDLDHDLDIHVANYRLQENFLWKNLGDGTFTNMAAILGVAGDEVAGWWGHTIGSEWGDYDNDGDLDLITANLAHPRYIEFSNKTMLYENLGAPQFEFQDLRESAGIKYEETHSDPSWGDVDKDGDLDLYITSVYEGRRSFLYENLGEGKFRDVTWLAGVRVFNGWGCAFSDFDQDGDLDLYVASGSGGHLFRNEGNTNNWLKVKVVGNQSNKAGIGTQIRVVQDGKLQLREVEGGKGTTSQHSLVAFFGFGEDESPVRVEVRFPSGIMKVKENVSLNWLIVVEE